MFKFLKYLYPKKNVLATALEKIEASVEKYPTPTYFDELLIYASIQSDETIEVKLTNISKYTLLDISITSQCLNRYIAAHFYDCEKWNRSTESYNGKKHIWNITPEIKIGQIKPNESFSLQRERIKGFDPKPRTINVKMSVMKDDESVNKIYYVKAIVIE